MTYSLGWGDLINNAQLKGDIVEDLLKSISYYFTSVLVYWWAVILFGGIMLAGFTTLIYKISTRISA